MREKRLVGKEKVPFDSLKLVSTYDTTMLGAIGKCFEF